MADRKLFYEDAALDRVTTRVVEAGALDGRPFVRLEETIFYPEGGGQPSDRGAIAGVGVLDVQSRGTEVLHFLERPLPASTEPVPLILDGARRFDFRQQHTAQHLLSAILEDRHGAPTTSFHLGDAYTAIEVKGPVPSKDFLRRLEGELNEAIRLDLPVRTRWVDAAELAGLAVRTRGLPDGHTGAVRLVEIEGIDLNTCGGTHVDRLAEIQVLRLTGAEPARGGARIRFLAGGRVLGELERLAKLEDDIKGRIGTAASEVVQVLDGWEAQRKTLERRLRDLERTVAEVRATELAAMPGPILRRLVQDAAPETLRQLALAVLAKRPEAVVVLVGAGEGTETCFLVQSGPDGPADVSDLGGRIRDRLGAKGGGKGRVFQGRGPGVAGEEVLQDL